MPWWRHICEQCKRKVFRSLSNKCMYCGHPLPESMHLKGDDLQQHLESQESKQKESQEFLAGMKPTAPTLQAGRPAEKKKKPLIWRILRMMIWPFPSRK